MPRLRFPRRPLAPTALVLALGALGWLAYGRWTTVAAAPRPEVPTLRSAPAESKARVGGDDLAALERALAALGPSRPEYTLQDCTPAEAQTTPAAPPAPGDPGKVDALDLRKAYDRARSLAAQTRGRAFKTALVPHWFHNGTRFWYRNDLSAGTREFIVVDAEKGTRRPAFDHSKLAAALSRAAAVTYPAERLPFDTIEFTADGAAVRFRAGKTDWQCDLASYACTPGAQVPDEEAAEPAAPSGDGAEAGAEESLPQTVEEPQQRKKGLKKGSLFGPARQARSPDGNWTAFVKDHNVYLRDRDDKETPVTTNGVAGNAYSAVGWSPDSQTVVTYRTEPGDGKEVYMIETSPRDQLPARLHTRPYPRPGDRFPTHEMWLIAIDGKKAIKVDVERIDLGGVPRLRWRKDARHFTFQKADRGHQRFRIIEVDARTGATRNLLDEKTKTFLWTAHPPKTGLPGIAVTYLDRSNEILLVSQRDGWKHLYLLDGTTGAVKNRVTGGPWVVRAIDRVDEDRRQVWFRAGGKNPGQDPYLLHYYRVNFDGTGLVALTEGNGNHSVQFSPDSTYLIDTYSRVDAPPVHELRRAADGGLVCKLDEADISGLLTTGWCPPEVFVAKGRDDSTDIWGIVCRPQNYDPNKKYPVIEYIYAGPHDSHVPKTFSPYRPTQALAELGFIVVQIDGMGTANRSRAFHDVCWRNLADAGFPDRIRWMKALARRYAHVDISRVGIYGTSAGGQSALGALLFHPEFYKVAVAACGCHDNRLDKASWNEQWMGLMGPHYEKQSNATNAHKLQGKLLLVVGEMDTNVPFESTMRVADALVRARKDFDLLVVPGMGHSSGGAYGDRRRSDFFVRHLHGLEPPNRNGE